MKVLTVVLWFLSPNIWNIGGLELTPGWYAAYVFQGETAQVECEEAKIRFLSNTPPGFDAVCTSAEGPYPTPEAEVIR